MERSFSVEVFDAAIAPYKDIVGDIDTTAWVNKADNIMYEVDGSVGLATFEYPGVYSVHWFFTPEVRGKKALALAKEMLASLFATEKAQAVRGLTRIDLVGARWACRKIGMTSYGIITIDEKDYELFCLTKKEFNNG